MLDKMQTSKEKSILEQLKNQIPASARRAIWMNDVVPVGNVAKYSMSVLF